MRRSLAEPVVHRGWTQGQLAERVGLTQTAVSRIDTGTRAVGSLELAELAEVLGVSVLELLRAGQRPMLAIAARLGHFRDPGAVDRALKRAGTLSKLDELLDSVLGAATPGPAPRGRGWPPDEDAFGTAGPDALGEILEEMAPGR
jgi:transcriptional regulator with XRE-family HTH domain